MLPILFDLPSTVWAKNKLYMVSELYLQNYFRLIAVLPICCRCVLYYSKAQRAIPEPALAY